MSSDAGSVYFSIRYNGAGLGDLINQLNFVYSYSVFIGAKFFIPRIYCSSHGVDYASELCISNSAFYRPEIDINRCNIIDSTQLGLGVEPGFNAVKWNYAGGNHYALYRIPKIVFPFADYYPLGSSVGSKLACMHLRMGDSRSYATRAGEFDVELMSFGRNARFQWTPRQVLMAVDLLKSRGYVVRGISDGMFAALRRISWAKFSSNLISKQELLSDVQASGDLLLSEVMHAFDEFVVEDQAIQRSLRFIASSNLIVTTSGTFVASIFNSFNMSERSQLIGLQDLLIG